MWMRVLYVHVYSVDGMQSYLRAGALLCAFEQCATCQQAGTTSRRQCVCVRAPHSSEA